MITVNLNDAAAQMPRLIEQALKGENIVFCKDNRPVLELKKSVAVENKAKPFLGNPLFPFTVPGSFFDPLPDDILDAFEGKNDK